MGIHSEIRISDRAGAALIEIEGVIGVPEKLQFEKPGDRVATYGRFTESLKKISGIKSSKVIVNIRSTGGDVNDALLIYEALCALEGEVTTRCYGYVASAATIIAQAASPGRREVSASTLYLIHCSESAAEGNSGMLSRTVELLDKTDERIAGIYAARSGMDPLDFKALMKENNGKGKWLSPEETVAAGLADKITAPEKLTNDADGRKLLLALESVAELLGITALPGNEKEAPQRHNSIKQRIVNIICRLFSIQQNKTSQGEPENVIPFDKTVNEKLPSDKEKTVFIFRNEQYKARPTMTVPVEDPSVGETRRSVNEQAYHEDSLGFRNK